MRCMADSAEADEEWADCESMPDGDEDDGIVRLVDDEDAEEGEDEAPPSANSRRMRLASRLASSAATCGTAAALWWAPIAEAADDAGRTWRTPRPRPDSLAAIACRMRHSSTSSSF